MQKLTTKVTIQEALWLHMRRKYGSQTKFAEAVGVSTAFISAVLKGEKQPTETILLDAGIEITKQWSFRNGKG